MRLNAALVTVLVSNGLLLVSFAAMRFVLLIITYLYIGACSTLPHVVVPVAETQPDRAKQIFITSHGWHTGFILPASEVTTELAFLTQRFGPVPYFEFGWGDKGFYQAEEITSGLTMRAILWPTETVMHVVAVTENPYRYFPASEVIELRLSSNELHSLQTFLQRSFFRDEHGQVVMLGDGIYGDSQFYEGQGEYYLMNTCNKWTAKGLKSAGMAIEPTFKLTADSIMSYLKSQPDRVISHSPGRE